MVASEPITAMLEEPVERRSVANVERHIQTILISLITGAIIFAAQYFYSDHREKGELSSQNQALSIQMQGLTAQMVDLRAEIRTMQLNFATKEISIDHETRIRRLETSISRIAR